MASIDPLPVDWRAHGETLGELLARRAGSHGEATFVHWLDDAGGHERLSYAQMHASARSLAAGLQARGVGVGERVLLVLPSGPAFFEAFFGSVMAGAVAVPVYPPARMRGLEEYQARLTRLIAAAGPSLILAPAKLRVVVEAAALGAGCRAAVLEPAAIAGVPATFQPPAIGGEALALVQFSSGSTGDPKGVCLSHRNVLANIAGVLAVVRPGPDDVNGSWLPLYHDMGLVGGLLTPLFSATPTVLMSPQAFLLDPKRWPWAIHRFRVTIWTAPNFAYHLLASRLDEAELAGVDLSCWRLALNGAEPIAPATLQAAQAKLGPHGFHPHTWTPVYGLAEMTVAAVFPPPGRAYRLDRIDAERLATEGLALPLAAADRAASEFVSVGHALPGYAMRIVDTAGAERAEREVGEVQLAGPSRMVGYLNDPAATALALDGDWLRTGDLGYIADGELYLVGRLKDLIVRGGRNYVPQDLERAAESVPGIRRGCVVAFGVPDATHGTEAVVLVAETRRPADEHAELARAVSAAVQAACGLAADTVSLLAPASVPKTSSGKLQRRRCRELWLAGRLAPPHEPGPWQLTRVVGRALVQRASSHWPQRAPSSLEPRS